MTDIKPTRIRHENARRRTLTVHRKIMLSPNFLAIEFKCDDFADFTSAAADDHIKLFLPGTQDDGQDSFKRDYTPRRFDAHAGTLVIEFALHEDPGPATSWAMSAATGDTLEIGGPRGSVVIPDSYDWLWLIGDETALPAIGRRLEELRSAPMRVHALVAVENADCEVDLETGVSDTVEWVHRPVGSAGDPNSLISALDAWSLPKGEGFVWIAGEARVARTVRERVLTMGQPRQRIKAAGYWTMGHADTTERFD